MASWHPVELAAVLAHWPSGLGEARPVPVSGLSGAWVWRVGQGFALRAMPLTQASVEVVRQRHQWMQLARAAGLTFVPQVLALSSGDSVLARGGWLWELQQWMPGQPDLDQPPRAARVAQACRALARLHRVWQPLSRPSSTAPALERRLAEWPDSQLQSWRRRSWKLHPCLVDIHRDHVLFEDDQVSGMIDYGTLQWDIPHADLARLLGSLAEDDEALWQVGLQAYAQLLPLPEVALIRRLDRVGTWIALRRWQRWLAQRTEVSPRAQARWQQLQRRVARWTEPTWPIQPEQP